MAIKKDYRVCDDNGEFEDILVRKTSTDDGEEECVELNQEGTIIYIGRTCVEDMISVLRTLL